MNLSKKQKLIIIGLLGLIIASVLVYIFYSRQSAVSPTKKKERPSVIVKPLLLAPEAPKISDEGKETLPEIPEEILAERLVQLTDFPAVAPAINNDGKEVRYYKKDGGDLYASDFSGKKQEKISSITIIGLSEAVWSPTKDRSAIFYLDRETLKSFIHVGTSSIALLPQDIKSFSWSPDGKNIAYLLRKNDKANLIMADSSGNKSQTVFSAPVLDSQLSWVSLDKIIFQTAPSGLAEGDLFVFSRSSGSFTKLKGGYWGLMIKWSPDGSKFMGSFAETKGGKIKMVIFSAGSDELFDTNLSTLPTKCAWVGNSEIYCGVPVDLDDSMLLPDHYLSGEITTSDQIIQINVDKKEIYGVWNERLFDISEPVLDKDQNYLTFIDKKSGFLWSLRLK